MMFLFLSASHAGLGRSCTPPDEMNTWQSVMRVERSPSFFGNAGFKITFKHGFLKKGVLSGITEQSFDVSHTPSINEALFPSQGDVIYMDGENLKIMRLRDDCKPETFTMSPIQ